MSDKKTFSLERVLRIAAEAFSKTSFEDVSIAAIAAAARCSTTTIYDVFGSKKDLFIETFAYNCARYPTPRLKTNVGLPSLDGLLRYASARISYLSDPALSRYMSSGIAKHERFRSVAEAMMARDNCLGVVAHDVRRCFKANLLRHADADAVAYAICAGTSFEPVVLTLLFGADADIQPSRIIRLVFTPLVTAKGEEQLNAYLDKTDSVGPIKEFNVWSRQHDELNCARLAGYRAA
jgi:AcrR family transcriptional regulator